MASYRTSGTGNPQDQPPSTAVPSTAVAGGLIDKIIVFVLSRLTTDKLKDKIVEKTLTSIQENDLEQLTKVDDQGKVTVETFPPALPGTPEPPAVKVPPMWYRDP